MKAIPQNELQCLRRHLMKANEILERYGMGIGDFGLKVADTPLSQNQRKESFKHALITKTKPNHLTNSKK